MASWGKGHVDVYARGMDSAIWHKWYLNNAWSDWQTLGTKTTTGADIKFLYEPVVITRKGNKIDVFAIGTDCALYYKAWSGKSWGNWLRLGGVCIGPPAVTSRDGTDIIDLVVMGTDHAMYHRWMQGDNTKWYPENSFERWGGEFTHQFSGCSWGNDHNSFFGVGLDGKCYERRWISGKSWQPYRALPGKWTGTPKSLAFDTGTIEVYGLGEKNQLNHVQSTGGGTSAWRVSTNLAGIFQSTPDAVSWDRNRIDIFCVGMDSRVYHRYWVRGSGWKNGSSIAGTLTHPVRVVSHSPGALSVFGIGTTFHLHHKWLKPDGTWGPSTAGTWEDLNGVLSSRAGGCV